MPRLTSESSDKPTALAAATPPYAEPQAITSLDDCAFYHTIDIPGYGLQTGDWDLRPSVQQYLGRVEFTGKRVLELGTANGFLCFHMESQGAEVVAFDMDDRQTLDVVPYPDEHYSRVMQERRRYIRKMNNAFWLAHRAKGSKAKVVYGNVYNLPASIGPVDVSVFGSILLHMRDPLLALRNASRLTRETVVVVEPIGKKLLPMLLQPFVGPFALLLPNPKRRRSMETWWFLPPSIVRRYLSVLGFGESKVNYFLAKRRDGGLHPYYTLVARRTAGSVETTATIE